MADTFAELERALAAPTPAPASFDFAAIEPQFTIRGWTIDADPARPLEFLRLRDVADDRLELSGSGTTTVATPALYDGLPRVDLCGATTDHAVPDATGRIRFAVDLDAPHAGQELAPGVRTTPVTRKVTLRPHVALRTSKLRATRRDVRLCIRALGGTVAARVRVDDARGRAVTTPLRLTVGGASRCRVLRRKARGAGTRWTVRLSGRDAFGHAVSAARELRLR